MICIRDRTGAITEGGEVRRLLLATTICQLIGLQDTVKRVFYIFAMRRDPTVFDPVLAWQVMEIGQHTVMDTW